MKWLSGAVALVVLTSAASASAADFLVLPARWSNDAELNAPSDEIVTDEGEFETNTPDAAKPTPAPLPAPMATDPPPAPAPIPEGAPQYEGEMVAPGAGIGYFTWFGQGCCERQPSCCDGVWDGYCAQRKQWCHKCPKQHCQKCVTAQPACGCNTGKCGHGHHTGWTGQHMACKWFNGYNYAPGSYSGYKFRPFQGWGGGYASTGAPGCSNCQNGLAPADSYDSSGEPLPQPMPTPAVPREAPSTSIQGIPQPVPTGDDRTALRPSLIPSGLRLVPWATGK